MELNLGALKQERLKITMPTGEVIHVKKPNTEFLAELYAFEFGIRKEKDVVKLFENTLSVALGILNNNVEKRLYDKEYLDEHELDYIVQAQIFKQYMEFLNKVERNPN